MFEFSREQEEKITEHFKKSGFEKIKRVLMEYSDKWNLEVKSMVDYYSINCIFVCNSENFGEAILKIGLSSISMETEVKTLKEYDGNKFCKLLMYEKNDDVLLEEYIKPGLRLADEKSEEKRVKAFVELFRNLHFVSTSLDYPTYSHWVNKVTSFVCNQQSFEHLHKYFLLAQKICCNIEKRYPEKYLLHGDLHYDNILLGENGQYKIVDPKGVLGARVFDIPRYLLNECWREKDNSVDDKRNRIINMINFFSKELGFSVDLIKESFFIENILAQGWNIEDGDEAETYEIIFAYDLLSEESKKTEV